MVISKNKTVHPTDDSVLNNGRPERIEKFEYFGAWRRGQLDGKIIFCENEKKVFNDLDLESKYSGL